MSLFRLAKAEFEKYDGAAEAAPSLQIALVDDVLAVVIGGWTVWTFDEPSEPELSTDDDLPWLRQNSSREEQEHSFDSWLEGLPEASTTRLLTWEDRVGRYWRRRGYALDPFLSGVYPFGAAPPSLGYGHLPFASTTRGADVFYRFEPHPKSRRINQRARTIAPDPYASPMSELPFLPTGFSVVARCALPMLFPACFRWELQPNGGTPIRCGTAIPLYGQSGGGVEVCFRAGASNRCAIADPVVLPPL